MPSASEAGAGTAPEPMTFYEKRVDAMLQLVAGAGGACAAAHRRAQERLRDEDYDAEAYYGRWLLALRDILVDAGMVSEAEVEQRVAALAAADAAGERER